ncbi:MAG: hypothetical protein AAF518_07865 [Spirochaetota bacterium]
MRNYLYLLLCVCLTFHCSQKNEDDYYDLYSQRVLLEVFVNQNPDPQASCVAAMQAAETCLGNASDAVSTYGGSLGETTLAALFSGSSSFTYAEYCTSKLESSYPKFTDTAKKCSEDCIEKYWSDLNTANTCQNKTVTDNISGIADGVSTCNTNCFRTTDEEIPYQNQKESKKVELP